MQDHRLQHCRFDHCADRARPCQTDLFQRHLLADDFLKGDETMKWQIHEAWKEPGYEAQFRFQDHPEAVDVSTTLNVDRFGTYEIRYCYEGKHCKVRTVSCR